MSVLSAFRLIFCAAASLIAVSGCLGSAALAQSRPDLDALVYAGSANSLAAPMQQPIVTVQRAQPQPAPRGLFTSASAGASGSGGAFAALGGMFRQTPRAVAQFSAQTSPIDAQAAMAQPNATPVSPAQIQVSPRNDLDTKAYGASPVAPSEMPPAPSQRGLLTGSKFTPSSGSGALAALGKGFRAPTRGAYAPLPVRYAPPAIAPSTYDATYRVDAGDRLRIVVYGQDGLTNTYQIGASGSITMPLIGGVPARGRTPFELAGAITARLRDGFIREPSVAVEIEAYRPFFILGEVAAPGQYPYVPHMSVESAIAIAGGFSPRAKRDLVTLTHSMPEGLLRAVVPVNTPLNPGDTIMVGERWF